ncbi:MAG: hypothetical protein GX589_08375 [Deltaproteobacteria bacterium]|nr:hypothetical protein [Deltaproteobacteria bacterium]
MSDNGQEVVGGDVPTGGATPKAIGAMESAAGERGGIVTAKGTGDGLVIRMDGRVDPASLRAAVFDFVSSRKGFLTGNQVGLEWVGSQPDEALVADLTADLKRDFDISVKAFKPRRKRRADPAPQTGALQPERKLSLFSGVEDLADEEDLYMAPCVLDEERELEQLTKGSDNQLVHAAVWDDADARFVYATLRSGQRIESEHSLVVIGDVNSGAEVIAGGDIVVLGTLRGVAHAGAYDETGGGRFIFALVLQPTQLRIGAIISRGGSESRKMAEIARVDDNLIVVEPYQARSALSKLRRL